MSDTELRILQIIPRMNGGGAEMTTLEITRALRQAGGLACIATEGGHMQSLLEDAGGIICPAPVARKNPWRIWRNIRVLEDICRHYRIRLIHARSRAPAWSAYYTARRLGLPFVTTYHGKVHERPRWKVKYNSVMARGDIVIANSAFTAKRIRHVHGIAAEKMRLIARGCDAAQFDPARFNAAAIADMKKDWNITANPGDIRPYLLVCPARLTPWKGQSLLLDALARLSATVPPFRLVLAGGVERASYKHRLEKQIALSGLQDRVIFAGHVANMPQLYAAADCVILPSLEAEPFGRTAIEAQASAVPVIAADAGGFRETIITQAQRQTQMTQHINGHITGWRFKPGDTQALADCLAGFFTLSETERRAIGQAGRQWVSQNYSLAQLCDKTLQLYQELIDEWPPRHTS